MHFVPHIDPALPFSTAVIVDGIAYMSGNIGILPDGSVPSGLETQSRLALDNMIAALKLAGCRLEDVFKCTVMLADMNDWPAFNLIYLEYFPASRLPARSAFGTTGLALGALVEIECLAKVPAI
jgi:reactive intermediate/imine deaminase